MRPDPIAAQLAQQNVLDAQSRTKTALQNFEDESIRSREFNERFCNNLALFSGGTIALSVTYLGYLKSTPTKVILYPGILIAAWIVLMICLVTSLFLNLLNSYYTHFARHRIYLDKLVEQKETYVQEMDGLYLVNVTPKEMQEHKTQYANDAIKLRKSRSWAKRREILFSAVGTGFQWASRLSFPVGLGLLILFAVKNM